MWVSLCTRRQSEELAVVVRASAIALAWLSVLALPCQAKQPLSSNPITVVIPYTAGASADVTTRMLTEQITSSTGQRFVIRNMPGAGAVVAAQFVRRAAPDGHTVLQLVVGTHATSQRTINPQPYDLLADFEPVTLLWNLPLFMVVPGAGKDHSVADLVHRAKTTPEGLNYASPGINSAGHFLGELLSQEAGAPMLHVPYKGASPAITDLIAGRVDFYYVSYASVISFVTSGRLKLLAVASPARLPLLKDVPTMKEAGFPRVEMVSQFGLAAPARTPQPIIARLNEMFTDASRDPGVAKKAVSQGVELAPNAPQEFRAIISGELQHIDEHLRSRAKAPRR
jgi:tripartite-type tricarboxylate transporter receptor subunit TctC